MKLKSLFFSIFMIASIFLIFEVIAWKILYEYYKRTNVDGQIKLKNIDNFSLFSFKETFVSDLELSTYYSFRFKSDYSVKREKNKFQTIYKGLLDEKYNNSNIRPTLINNETFDIYFFGGSTAFLKSGGVSLGKHIKDFLIASKCNKKFNYRVITAGHSGYATINQVNRLVSDIIYLKPEYVVFFDGINDFLHSHNTIDWQINDTIHQKNYRKIYSKLSDDEISFADFFQKLPNRFYTIFLTNKLIKRISGISIIPNKYEKEMIDQLNERVLIAEKDQFNEKSVINYIQNHKILDALANEFGFKTLHILQPTLSYDINNKISGYEKLNYHDYFPDPFKVLNVKKKKIVSNYYFDKSIKFYNLTEEKFLKLNNSENNKYVSYVNIFSNQTDLSKIYYDNVHYNDQFAINIISKQISNDILDTLNCY